MADRARFEPRFTLVLLYFAAFAVAWGLALAGPDLWAAWQTLPPDADPARVGSEVVRHALRGRVLSVVLAALVSLAALLWIGALPGLGRRRP